MRRRLGLVVLVLLALAAALWFVPHTLHEDPSPSQPVASVPAPVHRSSAANANRPPRPRARACLTPEVTDLDGAGELGAMRVGTGLSAGQIDRAFQARLDYLAACRPDDGEDHSGHVSFELEVGCNGLIEAVAVADDSLYEPAMIACLEERLRYVGFPAHDREEGVVFEYPLIFH